MRDIKDAIIRLPCEQHEYPKEIKATVFDVYDYGRALPRGLIVLEGDIWIVSPIQEWVGNCTLGLALGGRTLRPSSWRLETKVSDVVAYQRGSNFVKWRNYLRRIVRWPWKGEDTQEIQEKAR